MATKKPAGKKKPAPKKEYDFDYGDEDPVTCNRCGKTGLYWQLVFSVDGERSELFDNETDKRHVCQVKLTGMSPE